MSAPDPGREAVDALRRVVAGIEHAEERPGQDEMAHEVSRAIASSRPIIVQAGTGTGKSLGYLVPAVLSGKKTVVATATKTLQDQLGRNDLPLLAAALDVPFTWAVLKGRSNYVCAQRLRELSGKAGQMEIEETVSSVRREIDSIVKWASTTRTGDLGHIAGQAHQRASRQPGECGGFDLVGVQALVGRAEHRARQQLAQALHQGAVERTAAAHHQLLRRWHVAQQGHRTALSRQLQQGGLHIDRVQGGLGLQMGLQPVQMEQIAPCAFGSRGLKKRFLEQRLQ